MKKSLIAVFAFMFGLLGLQPASATDATLTVKGFTTMQSTLTSAQKSAIRTYLAANPGATEVSCVGYTGYNYLHVSTTKLQALARTRATAVCNYIRQRTGATITATSGVRTSSKSASARRTVVTFGPTVAAGYYTYSLGELDAGSDIFGAPTGNHLAGTQAATRFADGTLCMTDVTDLYSGAYYGTIFGGTAVNFGGWNTASDGSGTTYMPGDILPALAGGSHVTLYAIGQTG